MKAVYTYKIISIQIYEAQTLVPISQCNAIVFTNIGDNPVYINGEILAQGNSISNSGLQGEFDLSVYAINFGNTGTVSNLSVRQKVYN